MYSPTNRVNSYLKSKYNALRSLGVNAGRFAGSQGHDLASHEVELWSWAARVFQYDPDDREARAFWTTGFREGYQSATEFALEEHRVS